MMFPLSFIFLLAIPVISDNYKMVIIYGTPLAYTGSTTLNLTFYDCSDYCYETDGCMAVYSADVTALNCLVFQVGQITQVQELDSGGKVAMKMNNTDTTCPATSDGNSVTTGTTINEYNITSSGGVWTFTSMVCPDNFTMFERAAGRWCIGLIPLPTTISQVAAASACTSTYGGVLSGLDNVDEYNYIVDTVLAILPGIQSLVGYNTVGFWVNGERRTACMNQTVRPAGCNGTDEFTFTDPLLSSAPTGYLWGVQQPSGYNTDVSNCIHLGFNMSILQTSGTDDYKCDTANTTTAGFMGYVCGRRPTNG